MTEAEASGPRAPRVSVVIPTRGREALLRRALDSVRRQTFDDWEAIVVVDGPDLGTETYLRQEADPRIRHLVNPQSLGGAEARNVGISAARGDWVALLDDDDEWLPGRLERHVAKLPDPGGVPVIGFTRMIVRTPHGDYTWPRRAPRPGEHVSDYLFVRSSLFAGEGGVQTSAIIAPRSLFQAVPFDRALPRFQDTDWLLRATAAGATLELFDEPLSIWHAEQQRDSIASLHATDWGYADRWIRDRRALVTPRAYAAFLLIRGGDLTANALSPRGAVRMAVEAFRGGRPTLTPVLLFAGKWALPRPVRRWIRALVSRRTAAVTGAPRGA